MTSSGSSHSLRAGGRETGARRGEVEQPPSASDVHPAATVDLSQPGVAQEEWLPAIRAMAPWPSGERPPSRLVVVAPHPDDETLGVGGVIADAAVSGTPVVIVAVTDGEAAPVASGGDDLAEWRARERGAALRRLAPGHDCRVRRLRIPDGRVAEHRDVLAASLRAIFEPGDLVIGPLDCDGHPDHDAAGAIVRSVANECRVASALYPIWAWHWHCPETSVITKRGRRFDLPATVAGAKANAIRCFVSHTATSAPVLPSHFLARFATGYEVLVIP